MNLDLLLVMFQVVVLLFALSVHACVQAYAAMRLGDATAYMLGRVTLNPARHIDPWGTIVMPALSFFLGGALVGWAKPVPITLRNFRRMKRFDVLSTAAASASFLVMALGAMIALLVMKHLRGAGQDAVLAAMAMQRHIPLDNMASLPPLFPVALLLYYCVVVNILLFVFNLIPVPPLDMSRVIRYYLPYNVERAYDRMGMIGSFVMFFVAWRVVFPLFYPPLISFFDRTLLQM
jgi:Zn-dependent protease